MYQDHFNLTDLPFENTPNPAFFYGGGQYRECLSAMLHYVANRRGIMGLSGPIGVGKTTLIHTLRRVLPENTKVITLIHPESSPLELLTYVAQGLDLESMPESKLQAVEVVQAELTRMDQEGGVCLLIVDEAQLLTPELLEQLRLLSNLETETHKLIQVILVGQPELVNILNLPELAAVRQRVSLMKVLSALTPEESLYYIAHRLSRAGSGLDLFSDQALKIVVGYAGGIPRIINQLCEGALVSAFGAERNTVQIEDVEEAAANLLLLGEKMIVSRSAKVKLPDPLPEEAPPAPAKEPEPEPEPREQEPFPEFEPEPEPEPEDELFLDQAPPPLEEPLEQPPPTEDRPPDQTPLTAFEEEVEEEEDLTPGHRLPAEMVFESGVKAAPPQPARFIARRAKPILSGEESAPQSAPEDPQPEENAQEPKGNLEWSPPPPVPAPEDEEPKISILKPIIILAACLIILSAGVGFYLTWNKKPLDTGKQSTITAPVKPGAGEKKTD